MDEARRVLERLERIEALRDAAAEPRVLLGELRSLLREGEAWLAVEGSAGGRAGRALAGLEEALAPVAVRERKEGGATVV
jgi:hypothetical protein